jgi:hypothetical protein
VFYEQRVKFHTRAQNFILGRETLCPEKRPPTSEDGFAAEVGAALALGHPDLLRLLRAGAGVAHLQNNFVSLVSAATYEQNQFGPPLTNKNNLISQIYVTNILVGFYK